MKKKKKNSPKKTIGLQWRLSLFQKVSSSQRIVSLVVTFKIHNRVRHLF